MVLANDLEIDNNEFSEDIFDKGFSIYEVIRMFKGKPLFLKDNQLRLTNSIIKSGFDPDSIKIDLTHKIEKLISLDEIENGNLKYILHFIDGRIDEYIYQIKSCYPNDTDYENGVDTISLKAEREHPDVKYINTSLRNQTNELIRQNAVYEIVLVNQKGEVTEGSRSNLFFIKGNILYTAPAYQVLEGTSRKRVIDICKTSGIKVKEELIPYENLSSFQSAFITGTSPLILPIRRLDHILFDINNPLLRALMQKYFSIL